jgi:Orsellinic acid/F9775 biosynthesis cluster protein D
MFKHKMNFFSTDNSLKISPPVFTEVNNFSDLISTSILLKWSLAINTTVCLFICLACGIGHTSTGVFEHLKRKHAHVGIAHEDKGHIHNLIEQADISPTYPCIASSQTPCKPISGITIQNCAGCPYCPYTASKDAVRKHLKKEHSEQTGTPENNIFAQVINPGVTKILFRVMPPVSTATVTAGHSSIRQDLEEFNWKSFARPVNTTNPRLISPWLMRTRWHLHVQGYDIDKLCALVAVPVDDEFPGLQKHLLQYLESATDLLDYTDELVLQKINTADPEKT